MRGSDRVDLRDRLEYAGLRALLGGLALGGEAVSRQMGLGLGSFAARAIRLRRQVALDNMQAAFPQSTKAERVAIHKELCRNLGALLADIARMPRRTSADIRGLLDIDHPEHIHQLRREGRGGLLLTAHFGNWEILGAAVRGLGSQLTVLGARQRNPLVERLFSEYRTRLGMEAITVRQGLLPITRALRRGHLVASLADQDGGKDGFFLEFLGREASVQPGLFRLAARLQVPIITGFSLRRKRGWRAEIHAPIEPRLAPDPDAVEREARRLAVVYTGRVADYVRRHPDHWFWVHRRWKTRPPDETQPLRPPGR